MTLHDTSRASNATNTTNTTTSTSSMTHASTPTTYAHANARHGAADSRAATSSRGAWIFAFALPLALALVLLAWTRAEASPARADAPRRSELAHVPSAQERASSAAELGAVLARHHLDVIATANADADDALPRSSEDLRDALRHHELAQLQLRRIDVRGAFANLNAAVRELSEPDSGVLVLGAELELGSDFSALDGKLWIWN